jgi:Rps23 Pro-64 3,4-dihydroxylase Tpa1-like proline 4-hydroxylase
VEKRFRSGLFSEDVLKKYIDEYAKSEPYKHAVIHELMNDDLLRAVRDEVQGNVQFTPKETDIYKIHQSGDLANLDGLDDAALAKLPSLLKLRDALYSPAFRKYAAAITNSGALSGKKTDMAINIYTPGCHLLCHDDVIGSRRISYILYLPDPDIPWKPEWGGALRLYPTTKIKGSDGEVAIVPSPDFSLSVPPAWNQLSFFAVQPGLSFHDVEEVYHAETKAQQEKEGGRVRMAISGWFHIPQKGEEGYIEGAEEKLAEKSSLVQLQGKGDEYDFPKENAIAVESHYDTDHAEGLDEDEIEFLLEYLAPTYLTPDTMEQVQEHFGEQSSVTLDGILSKKFSAKLRKYVEEQEKIPLPTSSSEILKKTGWEVARPPHKHRFLYIEQNQYNGDPKIQSPIEELVNILLPSAPFRRWLHLATECSIENYSIIGRRFRKGSDYALATSHEGKPRLEVCLGFTPTTGWGGDEEEKEPEEKPQSQKGKAKKPEPAPEEEEEVGGHEVYMAGDDEEGDAAVYKTSTDDDDNVLFTVPACWNKMSIVLRDSGVLKFTKYVSRNAKGDRWDVSGVYGVQDEDDEDDEKDSEESVKQLNVQVALEDSEEEEFNGFPDTEDSDSD